MTTDYADYAAAYEAGEDLLRSIGAQANRDHAWSTACECDSCVAWSVAERMRLARMATALHDAQAAL